MCNGGRRRKVRGGCYGNGCHGDFRIRLEEEAEELSKTDSDTHSERLMDIYERLDELDSSTAETKASRILHGLGI